jgi:hypothetical protein
MTNWIDVQVTASPHRSLNMSKGIICCKGLHDCSDDEILDALRTEGVTNVEHILSNKNGVKRPTNTFVLTFAKQYAPKFVKAAYLKIPVEVSIPNPLQCFNCQRFGPGAKQLQSTSNLRQVRSAEPPGCRLQGRSTLRQLLRPTFGILQSSGTQRTSKRSVVHHSVRPNNGTSNSFKAAVLPAVPYLDGLALVMQRLLKRHVAYLRRSNSHDQLVVQHVLK